MRFAFIEQNEQAFQVTALCKTFGVSRSGYYDWKDRPVSETSQKKETLLGEIEVIHDQTKQVYGSPRVHQELLERGHTCCVNTVAKLMQQNELRAKTKKKFIATTNSNHALGAVIARTDSLGRFKVTDMFPDFTISAASPRIATQPLYTRYVKISEGCSNTCSFCIIPYIAYALLTAARIKTLIYFLKSYEVN